VGEGLAAGEALALVAPLRWKRRIRSRGVAHVPLLQALGRRVHNGSDDFTLIKLEERGVHTIRHVELQAIAEHV
jgi:hypothetical protein